MIGKRLDECLAGTESKVGVKGLRVDADGAAAEYKTRGEEESDRQRHGDEHAAGSTLQRRRQRRQIQKRSRQGRATTAVEVTVKDARRRGKRVSVWVARSAAQHVSAADARSDARSAAVASADTRRQTPSNQAAVAAGERGTLGRAMLPQRLPLSQLPPLLPSKDALTRSLAREF